MVSEFTACTYHRWDNSASLDMIRDANVAGSEVRMADESHPFENDTENWRHKY